MQHYDPETAMMLFLCIVLSLTVGPTDEVDYRHQEYMPDHRVVDIPVDIYWWYFPPYTLKNDPQTTLEGTSGTNGTDKVGIITSVIMDALVYCKPEYAQMEPSDYVT